MRMKQNQLSKFKWNSTLPKKYVTCSPFSLVTFQSHPSLCPQRVIPFVPGASLLQLFTCRFGFFSPGPFPSESSRLMGSLLHIVKQSLDFRSSSVYFPPLCASLPTELLQRSLCSRFPRSHSTLFPPLAPVEARPWDQSQGQLFVPLWLEVPGASTQGWTVEAQHGPRHLKAESDCVLTWWQRP